MTDTNFIQEVPGSFHFDCIDQILVLMLLVCSLAYCQKNNTDVYLDKQTRKMIYGTGDSLCFEISGVNVTPKILKFKNDYKGIVSLPEGYSSAKRIWPKGDSTSSEQLYKDYCGGIAITPEQIRQAVITKSDSERVVMQTVKTPTTIVVSKPVGNSRPSHKLQLGNKSNLSFSKFESPLGIYNRNGTGAWYFTDSLKQFIQMGLALWDEYKAKCWVDSIKGLGPSYYVVSQTAVYLKSDTIYLHIPGTLDGFMEFLRKKIEDVK